MLSSGGIVVFMMPPEWHRRGLDAIHDAPAIEDHTQELDRALDDKETLTADNMSAWIGPLLKTIALTHELSEAAVFVAQKSGAPQMAWKYDAGTLWAAAGEHGTFEDAFTALTEIDPHKDAIPITHLVRDTMGDDFPAWINEDDGESEPADRPALTSEQLTAALRPDDPDFPDDPMSPADEEAFIDIPGPDARRVRMTKGAKYMLDKQHALFIEKFGREPEGDDPLWFDPDADTPQPMSAESAAEFSRLWDSLNLERTREVAEARMEEHGMIERQGVKPGRNDPCPCGSGLKFKKCHGK
jgi:SEC-C motif